MPSDHNGIYNIWNFVFMNAASTIERNGRNVQLFIGVKSAFIENVAVFTLKVCFWINLFIVAY